MSPLSIASVTIAYNSERLLPRQLDALFSQSHPPNEVIVVNNNSSDGTLDLLSQRYPTVTVLDLPANVGTAGGYVAGLKLAALERQHDWVWLLDQDSVPAVDSLEQLVGGLASDFCANENVGVFAPILTHSETQLTYTGLMWRNGLHRPNFKQLDQPIYFVDAVISSGSLIRREVVERVGLPRSDFFIDFVDFEYCLRIRRQGYKVAVVRESRIDHAVGDPRTRSILGYSKTWSSHVPWREYYMSRNETFTIWNDYPDLTSKFSVLRRLLRHGTAIVLFGQQKGACLKMLCMGFMDGRAGKLGMRFGPDEYEEKQIIANSPRSLAPRTMPEISVIIVNWNGKAFLDACLSSLRHQTFRDFEVLFVDNGSTDGSADYVREHFSEVILVSLEQNVGFSLGNAAGYAKACGTIIALLNNDTETDSHWLEEIAKAARDFPIAGSFASKMLYFNERNRIDNCGFGITTAGFVVDLGRDEIDGPQWHEQRKVFGPCGGAAAYRRSMLSDVGFLDSDFFMTYEDVDLAFQAQLRGYDCLLVPGAVVYHRYRATMKQYWSYSRQIFFSQRNIEFVYWKNMPIGMIVSSSMQRLAYELGAALYFLKAGAGSAFLKGKVDAVRQFSQLMRKRREVQSKKTVTNAQLRSAMERDWLGTKWNKFLSAWRKPAVAMETKRS